MQLRHAARTDVGKTRDHNEDSYGIEAGAEHAAAGSLFVICDGMGGYASGEVASDLAVKTILSRFYALADERGPDVALEAAFHDANATVFKAGGGKMGTTSVAAVFRGDALIIANVGDCRAYLVRDGQLRQLTRDHSFVAEQVAAGMLTEEQARESSYRHIITRAIGHRPEIEVDLFREPLLQDDVLVLCSDGLHGQVEPDEIALAFSKVPLDDACRALIKLANERGGPDNITVVAVKVVELTFSPDSAYRASPTAALPGASTATAKTARLDASGQPVAAEGSTQQLPVYGPPPAIERRSGVDRRASAATGTPQRRASDRPASPPADESRSRIRSFLLSIVALLLLGALLAGVYYLALQNQAAAPTVPPLPTLTPIGRLTATPAQTSTTPQPTLVTVPTGTATP